MVFLKNLWLNGSLWNQKWFFYGIGVTNLLSTFIFKSVGGKYAGEPSNITHLKWHKCPSGPKKQIRSEK